MTSEISVKYHWNLIDISVNDFIDYFSEISVAFLSEISMKWQWISLIFTEILEIQPGQNYNKYGCWGSWILASDISYLWLKWV